jgi:hypothetical protein
MLGLSACSGSSDNPPPAGPDGAAPDDATVPFDAARGDVAPPPPPDAADAGIDGRPPPTKLDSGPTPTSCEPVTGPACDLVAQNCPPGDGGVPQQCLTQALSDGGYTTVCNPVTLSQHLEKGHDCCPSGDQNPCNVGLECVGNTAAPCDGGGVLPGRCTPHCCGGDAGDDSLCGTSVPEGYPGRCDVVVVDSTGTPLFNACTYELACKPFGLKACPPGQVCEVIDPSGTATCADIYVPDGGPAPGEGESCVALNNCQDGMVCLDNGDGTSSCYLSCVTPGTIPPFDAGLLDGGPGTGGCPSNEECNIVVQGFPAWLSFCGP